MPADYPKIMAKGISLNRNEIIKEEILEHQERTIEKINIWLNTIYLPSPVKFSKFCLTVKEIIILYNVVLSVYIGNI